MNSCPTCEKGFVIDLSTPIVTDGLLQHINDNTLEVYHLNDIPNLFFTIVESSIENLQKWVESFSIPKENPRRGKNYYLNIPKENFVYLLDNDFDFNVFFPNGKNLWSFHVLGLSLIKMLEQMIEHGYVISSDSEHREALCYMLDVKSIEEFDKLLDILNFTAEDGKKFIDQNLKKGITYDTPYLEDILHISKKYNLGDYVKSHSALKFVFEFVEKLD